LVNIVMSSDTPPETPLKAKKAPPTEKQKAHHFQKGADPRRARGNLAKRTKDGKTVTSLAREFTEEALLTQVEIMRDPDTPAREKLKAAENIISRGWGAAKQQIEMTATVEHEHTVSRINFAEMTQEARMNLLANMRPQLPPPSLPDAEYTLIENNRETDDTD